MQPAANVTSGDAVDWQAIDWKHVYRTVKNLRQRIFRASRTGDLTRVRSLQRLMLKSRAKRAGRCWGLCRHRHLIHLKVHVRIPALEDGAQLPVQRSYSRL
jgi:hypothetical protein